jgi:CheY-like chemotaxis protein
MCLSTDSHVRPGRRGRATEAVEPATSEEAQGLPPFWPASLGARLSGARPYLQSPADLVRRASVRHEPCFAGAVITPEAEPIRPRRVLLVDDEAALRAVVAETLRGDGYVVDEAGDGTEGLHRVRATRPDLILLDLEMPVLDGQGFIARCRSAAEGADIPIVIVSARPLLPDAPQEAGVKAVLLKPFDLGVLLAMVDRFTRAAGVDAA